MIIQSACNTLSLHGDVEEIAERMSGELIPAASDGLKPAGDGLAIRSGQDSEARRDTIEQDDRRLSELGRRTVEMFVVVHIFTEKLEVGIWGDATHVQLSAWIKPGLAQSACRPLCI